MVTATAKPRLTRVNLYEDAFRSTGSLRVDRQAGIIYGVKVVGLSSPNTHGVQGVEGTDYEIEALRRAKPLYEGINCNVDHPPRQKPGQERSARDRFAWLEGIKLHEAGLFGDLHFLDPQDPLAVKMLNAAEAHPEAFALSHNATGKGEVRNRRYVVMEIPEVHSVDIVADGGTNRSLFESKKMKTKVCEVLRVKVLPQLLRGRKKRLEKLLQTSLAENRSPLMEADEDSKDHRDHMYGAMRACEEAGNEDAAKGIHKLLDPDKRVEEDEEPESKKEEDEEEEDSEKKEEPTEEDMEVEGPGEGGTNKGPDSKGGPGAAIEGKRGKKAAAGEVRLTESQAQRILRLSEFEATGDMVKALTGATLDQAEIFIQELKRQRNIGRKASAPRSTAPLREGRGQAPAPIPSDLKSWAESLKA